MKYVELGETGVKVSALCLGTMHFGNRDSINLSYNLLDEYCDYGGNFLDTANIYSFWINGFKGGESESVIGDWIKRNNKRKDVFLATKVGFAYPEMDRGLNASQIIAECEKSLTRLKTDTIDLYYAHVDDRNTPIEETMEAFHRLVTAGKVRFLGASNYFSWRLEEARSISRLYKFEEFCCVQQRYTYLQPKHQSTFEFDQVNVTEDLLSYCKHRKVSLLAYSTLLNGSYSNPAKLLPSQYQSSNNLSRITKLKSVASKMNVTVNQVIFLWLLSQTPQIIPVIGVSSIDQLNECIKSLCYNLSATHLNELNCI